jgi:hypothetical protein
VTPQLQQKLIHAIVQTGDLASVQEAGVDVDWLDDLSAKSALQAILDYSNSPRTAGQVPGVSYLAQRLAMVPGVYDTSETLSQILEAVRTARLSELNGMAFAKAMALNATDPVAARLMAIEALTGSDIEALSATGREITLEGLLPILFKDYAESMASSGVTGVLTPFEALTNTTKGWQRGELYTVYASAGSYKSWVLLAYALVALRNTHGHVLIVTSEMPAEQLGVRLVCLMHGWNFNSYRDREIPLPQVAQMLGQEFGSRVHFHQPTGHDAQAIAEVRNRIKKLNMIGGVSLVLWDGHYRSASKQDWEYIYDLVRKTRALALEKEILQPPIIVATQEGSEKGKATHAVYRQESSLMMFLTKVALGRILMQTTKVREGPSVEIEIDVNLRLGVLSQIAAKSESDGHSAGTGGLV